MLKMKGNNFCKHSEKIEQDKRNKEVSLGNSAIEWNTSETIMKAAT